MRDVQQVALDQCHGALQVFEFTFVAQGALLHAHHTVEQRPAGQPQQCENRNGYDQFEQGEAALIIHDD
ncbi:hypothetical protein D3C78_1831300 [compost metagenome]